MIHVTHQAAVAGTVPADYRCSRCGFSGEAVVVSEGWGSGMAPGMLDTSASRADAIAAAKLSQWSNARRMLDLVPCPKCGQRTPARVARAIAGIALRVLGVWGLCGAAAWLLLMRLGGGARDWPIGLGLGAIAAGVYYGVALHWQWAARQRVGFIGFPLRSSPPE